MKFCTNCGTKLDDSAVFCYNCGTRCQIQPAPAAPVAPATPVMPAAPAAPEASDCTEAPATLEAPAFTEAPVATEAPAFTEAPVATEAPAFTEVPATSEAPAFAEVPATSEAPAFAEVPATSEAPAFAEVPAGETVAESAHIADADKELVPPVTEETVSAGFQAPPASQFNQTQPFVQAPQYNQAQPFVQAPQYNQAPPFGGQPAPQVYGQPEFQPNGQHIGPEAASFKMDARRNKAIGLVSDAVSGGAGVVLAISFVASTIFSIVSLFTSSGNLLNAIVAFASKLGSVGEYFLDYFGPALESIVYSGRATSIVIEMIGLTPAILSTIGLLILLFGKNKRPLTSAGFTLMKVAAVIMVVCSSILATIFVVPLIIGLVSTHRLSSSFGGGFSNMASTLIWVILPVVAAIFTLVILFYAKKARTITIIRNAASTGDYSFHRPSIYYVVFAFIVVLFRIIETILNWKAYMDWGIFSAVYPVTTIIQTVCSIVAAVMAPIVVCKARSAMNMLE